MLQDYFYQPEDPPHLITAQPPDWPDLAFWPKPVLDSEHYRFSALRRLVPTLATTETWSSYQYLIQDSPSNQPVITLLKELYPEAHPEYVIPTPDNTYYSFVAFEIECASLEQVSRPLVEVYADLLASVIPEWTDQQWLSDRVVRVIERDTDPPQAVVSVGVWVPQLSWQSFQIHPPIEYARLWLGATELQSDEVYPLARGIHTLNITMSEPPPKPIQIWSDNAPRDHDRLLGPLHNEQSPLFPDQMIVFDGYVSQSFYSDRTLEEVRDYSVSPSGNVALLRTTSVDWRIEIIAPDGEITTVVTRPFESARPGSSNRLDFADDHSLYLITQFHLYRITLPDHIEELVDLREYGQWCFDLAANLQHEIFVSMPPDNKVCVLDRNGRLQNTLEHPTPDDPRAYRPTQLSAAHSQYLAVGCEQGVVYVYSLIEGFEQQYQIERTIPAKIPKIQPLFRIRQDGWVFLVNPLPIWTPQVLDPSHTRYVASSSLYDLSTHLSGIASRFLGFDESGIPYARAQHQLTRLIER